MHTGVSMKPLVETWEYGLSHADLARILPRLLPDARLSGAGLDYRFEWPSGAVVTLLVGPEQARRIASIAIPYVQLEVSFQGMDEQARGAFKQRFQQCFQKGGG